MHIPAKLAKRLLGVDFLLILPKKRFNNVYILPQIRYVLCTFVSEGGKKIQILCYFSESSPKFAILSLLLPGNDKYGTKYGNRT